MRRLGESRTRSRAQGHWHVPARTAEWGGQAPDSGPEYHTMYLACNSATVSAEATPVHHRVGQGCFQGMHIRGLKFISHKSDMKRLEYQARMVDHYSIVEV
jgi:hypothetical protein